MEGCGVTDLFNVACGVCIVSSSIVDGLFMGLAGEKYDRNVVFGAKEVGTCKKLLLAVERVGER